ncbi:hypothetical protein [Paenibacillus xylanexedens]|uniref:hypothetical protein n=1 Tax=Paenibacillus xylanexedens TaxID=528191 RepID=UPI000F54B6EE|nr:hypothetical protein [Paenibacillus xylanexedens]
MKKQSFFKVTAINVREMPRRSKRLAMLQNLNTAHPALVECSFQQSDSVHDVAEEAEMPRRSEALAFITGF